MRGSNEPARHQTKMHDNALLNRDPIRKNRCAERMACCRRQAANANPFLYLFSTEWVNAMPMPRWPSGKIRHWRGGARKCRRNLLACVCAHELATLLTTRDLLDSSNILFSGAASGQANRGNCQAAEQVWLAI